MHLGRQPADARAEDRPAEHVRRKVLAGGNPQGGHAERAHVEQYGIAGLVRQSLAPRHHQIRGGRGERDRRVSGRERALAVGVAGRRRPTRGVQHRSLATHDHFHPVGRGKRPGERVGKHSNVPAALRRGRALERRDPGEPDHAREQRATRVALHTFSGSAGTASSALIPANPITPASNALLAVPADPEKVWRATRSTPGSDAGSHGAVDPQEGGAFGSLVASGMRAATPAATTDTASPQLTLYGACARADAPETARSTRAAAKRRIRAPIRVAGGIQLTCAPRGALMGRISRGLAVLAPVRYPWG